MTDNLATDFTASSLSGYEYRPFPQKDGHRWIRVLDLLPSENRAAAIKLCLRTVALERDVSYEAISYVWGSADSTVAIFVADDDAPSKFYSLRIRTNLANGLRVLRHPDKKRMLWADAICINQNDPKERSHQVGMMGLVFWLAKHVLIWLGLDERGIAQAVFDTIKPAAEAFWHPAGNPQPLWGTQAEINALDPRAWGGIDALYRNPWFERVWVQQEVGLAKTSTFFWGDSATAGPHDIFGFDMIFERIGNQVRKHFGIDKQTVTVSREQWLNYGRSTRASWVGDRYEFMKGHPFLVVVASCAECKATDPRDYIYALLGHPTARQKYAYRPEQTVDYLDLMNQGEGTLVEADYNKSVDEVFLETAISLLRQHRDLSFLGAVRHTDESLARDYPSWVPRWDQIRDQRPLGTYPGDPTSHMVKSDNAPPILVNRGSKTNGLIPQATLGVFGLAYKTINRLFDFSDGSDWMEMRIRGRRFFRTSSEQDGFGPTVARAGDTIAIVVGSFVPCIFRPVGGEDYKFIGTCVVYGIMNGEMTRILQEEESKLQPFNLV